MTWYVFSFIMGIIVGICLGLAILFLYFHIKARKFTKDVSEVYENQLKDFFDKY